MGLPHEITKVLAAAAATNVALSQSPGAGVIVLNGSTAAGAGVILNIAGSTLAGGSGYVGGTYRNVPLTGGSGSGALADIVVSSAGAVVAVRLAATNANPTSPGTGTGYVAADALSASAANLGNTGGSGFLLTLVAANLSTAVATLDTQRRIIITSGGNDTGITFTINGAGDNGVAISDTITGASGAAAQSNLDFKTITSVTHTGSVNTTVTVGTNGVGSTPWFPLNWHAQPFNVELSGQVLSGSANWGWQYTYQDPNNLPSAVTFPQPVAHPTLNNQSGFLDGPVNDPVAAVRLIVNSGTGTVLGTIMEAGISGQ